MEELDHRGCERRPCKTTCEREIGAVNHQDSKTKTAAQQGQYGITSHPGGVGDDDEQSNDADRDQFPALEVDQEKADRGSVTLGETVELAYVDQSRDDLAAKKTVWEEVSDGLDLIRVGPYEIPSRAYLGRFNFRGQDQQKRVGDLSGGERNRLHLAKLLKRGANVLLLDEPTNDLDVETLRALEEALLNFPGTVLVISHDRWFLDRIATHILAFEGDSHVEWFSGNFSDYDADLRRRVGDEAAEPHRIKYKRIGG